MADAFENLKSAWNRGITTISVKTSSSLEKSKLKTHIESLTKDIEREYSLIGEEAYKLWQESKEYHSVVVTRFETVLAKQQEIAQLNEQLASIDERDSKILGNASAPAEKPEDTTPKFFCGNCGAQYDAPVKFCRKCGNKMAE